MRASLMPAKWRGGGAGGGAVCAALVGAAPVPRPLDLTPSTDLSTLALGEGARASAGVQTDDSALYPRLRDAAISAGVALEPRRLSERAAAAGLPSFAPRPRADHAVGATPPIAVAVAVLGAELPL